MDSQTRYEVFLPNFDFRDYLPLLDRKVYRLAFNPMEVWVKLGSTFNQAMWARFLKKYRVRMDYNEGEFADVSGDLEEECKWINLLVSFPKDHNIDHVKFLLVQTMMHEYIHANQFYAHEEQYEKIISSWKPVNEEEEYLSKFGEIQAFAHCAALDQLNGIEDTVYRYSKMSPKTRKAFYIMISRWVHKYSNKYNINNVILIEKHESTKPNQPGS